MRVSPLIARLGPRLALTLGLSLALGLTLGLAGCANVSRVDVGPLTAFGETLESADTYRYYLVRLDARGMPSERLPALALPLPGSVRPVPLGALTPALAARHLPRFVPPPQWPDTWKEKARQRQAFQGDGFYIDFGDAGLEFVSLCSHCHGGRQEPGLCTADGNTCHLLPLTGEELVELVGTPDRVRKVREVTY